MCLYLHASLAYTGLYWPTSTRECMWVMKKCMKVRSSSFLSSIHFLPSLLWLMSKIGSYLTTNTHSHTTVSHAVNSPATALTFKKLVASRYVKLPLSGHSGLQWPVRIFSYMCTTVRRWYSEEWSKALFASCEHWVLSLAISWCQHSLQ